MISKINIQDLQIIELIGKMSLPIYFKEEDLSIMTLYKNISMLKISLNNIILGFIIYENNDDNLHILSIAVIKNARKKNLGTKLLNFIKKNNKDITLYVQAINHIAVKFYKKNNFKCIRTDDDYYTSLDDHKAFYLKYDMKLNK